MRELFFYTYVFCVVNRLMLTSFSSSLVLKLHVNVEGYMHATVSRAFGMFYCNHHSFLKILMFQFNVLFTCSAFSSLKGLFSVNTL